MNMNELVNEVENLTDESVELDMTADQESEQVDQEAETEGNPEEAEKEESTGKEVKIKTLENAITRRDKKINKLKAENRHFMERLSMLEEKIQGIGSKEDPAPKLDDYDSVEAFVEAVIEHKTKNTQKQPEQPQVSLEEQQRMQVLETKYIDIMQKANSYAQEIPDFRNVWEQSQDIFNEMPEQIAELFFHVDDGALAAYNLAKSGKLESLSYKHPSVAAMEIYAAQKAPVKQVTNAPKPIRPLRGNGSGQKSTDEMSGKELLKKYRIS